MKRSMGLPIASRTAQSNIFSAAAFKDNNSMLIVDGNQGIHRRFDDAVKLVLTFAQQRLGLSPFRPLPQERKDGQRLGQKHENACQYILDAAQSCSEP